MAHKHYKEPTNDNELALTHEHTRVTVVGNDNSYSDSKSS